MARLPASLALVQFSRMALARMSSPSSIYRYDYIILSMSTHEWSPIEQHWWTCYIIHTRCKNRVATCVNISCPGVAHQTRTRIYKKMCRLSTAHSLIFRFTFHPGQTYSTPKQRLNYLCVDQSIESHWRHYFNRCLPVCERNILTTICQEQNKCVTSNHKQFLQLIQYV